MARILAVADEVVGQLWTDQVHQHAGVDLIVAAGDLPFDYLEHLANALDKPLVFVPGNHDVDLSGYSNVRGLWTKAGVPVRWPVLLPDVPLLHLPPTPLRAEHFEIDYNKRNDRGSRPSNGLHAMPVELIELPDRPTEVRWQVTLDPSRQSLWSGHRVAGEIVFPAAGYLDLALSLASRVWGSADGPLLAQALVAEQFRFERALYLQPNEPTYLHVIATKLSDEQLRVEFATAHSARHAEGIVRRVPAHGEATARLDTRVDWASGVDEQSGFYAFLHSLGLQYTGPFRAVSQAFYGAGRGFGRLVQEGTALAHKGFTLHPAVLDVCFQLAFSSDEKNIKIDNESRGRRQQMTLRLREGI